MVCVIFSLVFFVSPRKKNNKKKNEEIRGRMLEIDPQLRNNARLQNCLVAWEDAWVPWLKVENGSMINPTTWRIIPGLVSG